MVTTQHTVAVTALSSNTWQPAELVRPAQTESLVSSLSTMLSAANTSPVLDRSIPSQQARRKRRRKRRKNRNALDLLGGHGAPFRDNNQSDYSLTSSTPASSDTEDRRSRPGTPTAINSSSLMSPILSPIMSPAMEPIRVDELEGMEALGLGHGFMNSTTGTGNGLVSTSTPTTSSTHREAYRRRKEVSMNYSRVSEANTGRPCSPLRLTHLLERVNSAEKVIGEGSETNEEACNRSTGSERILSVLHPLSRELSADSQLAEEAASPVVPTTTMEPINITKALLTLSLNDTADALATATAVPPPDSAISLCMAQANTNDTDDGVKTDRSINVDDIDEGDTSLLALHDNDIDSSSCDGDDDDDGEEEYDPEENEQSLCCYEEDPTEYDDNSIIEAELDDDVPELPSLMGTVHSSTSRTNTIGAILKAVKQHSYTNEWPMDEEERKRLEEEGLLEDLHEHHHDSNTKDDADIDDCRLVPRRSDSDTHKEDNVTASSSEENIPVDTAIPSSNEDPER
ncbi:hypothetical protein BDF22DRAFT_740534 [Syncephalis plumigaleata]|nr:hypothetical protein BDF22DRAFT_740534 [Syncephalis plumigaleata]